MRNGKHITNRIWQQQSQTCLSFAERQREKAGRLKQKFPRLSNLHIIWVFVKRLTLAGFLVAAAWAVMNSSAVIFLTVAVGFVLIRSLMWLVSRIVITVVYIILLVLILSLVIF